jgi:hypothetical protein
MSVPHGPPILVAIVQNNQILSLLDAQLIISRRIKVVQRHGRFLAAGRRRRCLLGFLSCPSNRFRSGSGRCCSVFRVDGSWSWKTDLALGGRTGHDATRSDTLTVGEFGHDSFGDIPAAAMKVHGLRGVGGEGKKEVFGGWLRMVFEVGDRELLNRGLRTSGR